MRICSQFKVGELIEYMQKNDVDILKELEKGELFVVIDMIALGDKCSEEEASNKFQSLLKEYSYTEIISELAYEIIGRRVECNDETVEREDKSFLDILTDFYDELQTVDNKITISEFLNMNSEFMYRYADGIKKRYLFNKNERLRECYEFLGMYGQLWNGKLKECPQYDEDGSVKHISDKEKLIQKIESFKRMRERGV